MTVQTQWPRLPFDATAPEPHFLFIVTLPFSGSTALSQLINTSHRTTLLDSRGEGQWLIPALTSDDRWDPDKYVDYESVKSVWLHRFQFLRAHVGSIDVVIEKSPASIVRMSHLATLFSSRSFLANNRHPLAQCASAVHREREAPRLRAPDRCELFRHQARLWVQQSMVVRDLVRQFDIPLLTYEQFCKNPARLIEVLELPEGVAETIDTNATVKVKDYRPQKIINQNERQIALLEENDRQAITGVLADHQDLLEFFGYNIRNSR